MHRNLNVLRSYRNTLEKPQQNYFGTELALLLVSVGCGVFETMTVASVASVKDRKQ